MRAFDDPHSKPFARMTGVFYLTIAVAGGFSIAYVPSVLSAPGDPSETITNILENPGLFNLGLAGEVVVLLAEVMVTALLYCMFKSVNPALSIAAAFARIMMVAVMATMLFFTGVALDLIGGDDFLSAIGVDQHKAWALVFLQAHDFGVLVWQLFFTLHLLLLGYLVIRSGAFPRLIGLLMMIGSLGYLLDSIAAFAFPDMPVLALIKNSFLVIVTLGELSFALWLVTKGAKTEAFPK